MRAGGLGLWVEGRRRGKPADVLWGRLWRIQQVQWVEPCCQGRKPCCQRRKGVLIGGAEHALLLARPPGHPRCTAGLYRGTAITLVRDVPSYGIYYCSFEVGWAAGRLLSQG